MARSKNSLTDVSPSSGQLKQKFSYLERTQLNALSKTSGSLGYGAGKINSSVSNSLANYSLRDRSKLEIGSLVSEGLENSGLTSAGSGDIISSIFSPSIDNRKPFYTNIFRNDLDLSVSSNRVPDPYRKSPQEKIEDKKISSLGLGGGALTFPNGLSENAHAFMKLNFYEYKRPDKFKAGGIDPTLSINLPLPENFTQEFQVDYQSKDIESFGQAIAEGKAGDVIRTIESNMEAERSFLQGVSATSIAGGAVEVAGYAGRRALLSANESIGGLVGQTIGAIPNPHPSVFLNGVQLRQYTLAWKLVPRSEDEAAIIRKILKAIKDKALPKKSAAYLTYPNLIEPVVISALDDIGHDYKKSLMGGMTINYSAEGTSAFFYDGHPVSIELTLNMQEVELYLEESEKQLGSLGTPIDDGGE